MSSIAKKNLCLKVMFPVQSYHQIANQIYLNTVKCNVRFADTDIETKISDLIFSTKPFIDKSNISSEGFKFFSGRYHLILDQFGTDLIFNLSVAIRILISSFE